MIGQRCVQQQIKSAIEGKSLARFIILVGDRGSGRKTLAKEVSKWLKAECVIVEKGVEALREVIEQSYRLSSDIIYVLDGDTMSVAAKSALLKVTEEPPNKARFILTVSTVEKILPTLTSRACVYRMDNYTSSDIAQFAGTEDWRYPNFCTNKYEVDLLKSYGIEKFTDFVKLVVDNISQVSSANVFKIGQQISFKDDTEGYDVKVFLQAFRTECLDRVQQFTEYPDKMMYLDWIAITTETIATLRISAVNRQPLFDRWIFDIRKAGKIAER